MSNLKFVDVVARQRIVYEILQERKKQDMKWGDQSHHPNLYWLGILVEEVGEVAKALIEDDDNWRYELVQVAAVALSWLETLERSAQQELDNAEEMKPVDRDGNRY